MGKGNKRRPLGKADRREANRLYAEGYERIWGTRQKGNRANNISSGNEPPDVVVVMPDSGQG